MTPLRQRMIEDLQLKGYSDSTQTLYVSAVRQLCEHFDKSSGNYRRRTARFEKISLVKTNQSRVA